MFANIQRIHFVGIGGIGMSGIAEVLLNLGYKVSGSDVKASPVTQRLASLGAVIYEGHEEQNAADAEVVVVSSAISPANPEVLQARRLMRLKYGIAIAGMHGKTTTTSMVAAVLAAGGLDPTVVVGGRVDAMGSNARLGNSQYLVAEADESDRSFLNLSPILSVVTNIDREHMDCYRNMRDVKRTFVQFMDLVPFYGTVVVCNDDPVLRGLLPEVQRRTVTYGTRRGSDLRITAVNSEKMASETTPLNRFEVRFEDRELGEFTLHVPGLHNVLNATAAIAVGLGLDVPVEHIRSGLDHFRGVDRRFQLKGKAAGVTVIDDYGHHPTEIKATLSAARQCGFRKVHVIFQPHRYSRTQALMEEFATAFGDAETIWVLDVYPASEAPIEGVTGEVLAERIRQQSGKDAKYQGSFSEAAHAAVAAAEEGDMILTLGAGNVSQLGASILEKLQAREAVASK